MLVPPRRFRRSNRQGIQGILEKDMLRFDKVTKRYPGAAEVFSQVSFELADGEMAFLTGPSGAGKSTLLKLIILIERATRGEILLSGRNLRRTSAAEIARIRRQVGVVFQNHQLLFDRNVFENVALPLTISGFHRRETARRVRAALSKVGLSGREQAMPITLSGGEQQRVGIARAVVNKPPLLLADEPTGNLDPDLSRDVMNLFREFNQVGVSVLIASHDLQLVEEMQTRVFELGEGRLTIRERRE